MKCKCPKDYPQERERDYECASTRFWKRNLPAVLYTFRVHSFPCLKIDEWIGVRLVASAA